MLKLCQMNENKKFNFYSCSLVHENFCFIKIHAFVCCCYIYSALVSLYSCSQSISKTRTIFSYIIERFENKTLANFFPLHFSNTFSDARHFQQLSPFIAVGDALKRVKKGSENRKASCTDEVVGERWQKGVASNEH